MLHAPRDMVQLPRGVWQADFGRTIFIGVIVNHANLLTYTLCNCYRNRLPMSCNGSFAWPVRSVGQSGW